jgi:hypothetical protein
MSKSQRGRPRKLEEEKTKWNDTLICTICESTFIRANQTRHKNSKIHKMAEKLTCRYNEKFIRSNKFRKISI